MVPFCTHPLPLSSLPDLCPLAAVTAVFNLSGSCCLLIWVQVSPLSGWGVERMLMRGILLGFISAPDGQHSWVSPAQLMKPDVVVGGEGVLAPVTACR